jgi:hypothetical protein
MNKWISLLCLLAIAVFAMLIAGRLEASGENTPTFITINDSNFHVVRKGPVRFSHSRHSADYDIACAQCHHDFKNGVNIWKEGDPVSACSECHDAETANGDIPNLKLAFHRNCQKCHKAVAGGENKAPFLKCNGCHALKKG